MTKSLRLTFRYKSDGDIKVSVPLLDDLIYIKNPRKKSAFAPTEAEKAKEKWLPYIHNRHVLISNFGGLLLPNHKKPMYPEPHGKMGYVRFAYVKPEAFDKRYGSEKLSLRLGLEVCRLFVPVPTGRTIYSRRLRDGNPLNCRAENMTIYTGYRNTMKTNPYLNYQTVINMIEKRKAFITELRSRGIDPFNGW